MNKLNLKKLITCLLIAATVTLASLVAQAEKATSAVNTNNEVSAPRTKHPVLYTISAEDGLLVKDEKHQYHLTLKNVQHNVVYNTDVIHNHTHTAHGLQPLTGFVKSWHSKKPTGYVEADVTGVQIDNKTMGHTQFYASVLLSKPVYNSKTQELSFDFTADKTPINVSDFAQFHNATIYVNGCSLCDCSSKKGNCDIILMRS